MTQEIEIPLIQATNENLKDFAGELESVLDYKNQTKTHLA